MKSTNPGMMTLYAVKHHAEAEAIARKAREMREANEAAFERLRELFRQAWESAGK